MILGVQWLHITFPIHHLICWILDLNVTFFMFDSTNEYYSVFMIYHHLESEFKASF